MSSSGSWKTAKTERDRLVTRAFDPDGLMGGLLAQHADLSLQLQFSRYRETLAMGDILSNVVSTSKYLTERISVSRENYGWFIE